VREAVVVVGARPNFMKVAPVLRALGSRAGVRSYLVHTGQHYDDAMSRVFFEELEMPRPDRDLEIGSDTHARQAARIMIALDELLEARAPDLVVVAGDVNSTLAGGLTAAKRGIPLAHIEAGLRSGDRTMPEEINRLVTDAVSDLLFATSPDAVENLLAEGIPRGRIHLVGNPMIDSLLRCLPRVRGRRPPGIPVLRAHEFALVTLHRPSNVDDPRRLRAVLDCLNLLAARLHVVFPVHPRTQTRIRGFRPGPGLHPTGPLGYLDFLGLMADARLVVTDSGGVQEETTALGVPCLTLRANTERPITLTEGTNQLLGTDPAAILPAAEAILGRGMIPARAPALWDGRAGERIAQILADRLSGVV
jgi:UDP-N-acetylglucosamine 2-epimerase (non-hydrolysing)